MLGNMVGVAGFEPATPSSRTRCIAISPSKYQRYLSRSEPFVSFCSRYFCPHTVPLTLPRLAPGSPGDGVLSRLQAAAPSCRESRRHAKDRRRPASATSRKCGAGREASRPHRGQRPAPLPQIPCVRSATGLPFHSTTASLANPRADQRRIWASRRGGNFTGGWRFLGFAAADGAAIEHALLKVDVPAADRRHQRSAADRGRTRPGLEADQEKPGDVPAHCPPAGLLPHALPPPPSPPHHPPPPPSRH